MGHKILLADDSITIQKVIELTFSDEDFELHTVGNGQKAIDEIRAIQPDIVLCDIIMPEKNGYEVCEFIKSTDELKHIPVLLLTGAFEPFDQERAKAAGCEGFLAKPFEPQTLISKVKELLAGAQSAPAAAASAPAIAPAPPAVMPPAPAPLMPDAVTQDAGGYGAGDGDATVMAPPAMGSPPPAIGGPQVPAMSVPPSEPSSGLDEGFAVEAGDRELAMDPGDHTMLLGANDTPDVPAPPGTPPGASDDIWSNVSSQSEPPAQPAPEPEDDDGATIFVAEPLSMPLPGEGSLGGPVDNEMSVGHEDPDATWQMPSPTPETPSGDLGGFEDFAAPPVANESPQMAEPPSMEPMEVAPPAMDELPPMGVRPIAPDPVDPFTPDPPELGSTNEVSPVEVTPEPIPSVDTHATMDPVAAGSDAFSPLTPTPEPASPEPPPMTDMSPEMPTEMPPMPTEPETQFTSVEPANELPSFDAPAAPTSPAPPKPTPVVESTPVAPSSAKPPAQGVEPAAGADDDLVERVAQRVVDKLSSKIIQEIAWEVVPDLAEGMIQREIDVLKSKIPKSG